MKTAWGAAAVLALGLCTAVVAEARALRYKVEGAGSAARENIRAYLGESPDDTAAAERFLASAPQRARDALQALGLYDHELTLSVDRSTTPWRVTITVSEGEPLLYTDVDIELRGDGDDDPELEKLLGEQAPDVGDVVHHGRYEDFKRALQVLARQRGYFDARFGEHRVEVNTATREAVLSLQFDTGIRYRFGAVSAQEAMLDPGLLQRLLPFAEGDPYQQSKLLELRQRLLRLGFFSSVVVLPDLPARQAPTVPLRVEYAFAPRHSFELGAGYSTDTRQRFSVGWRSPRLNRHGHSQDTVLRWSPVNPEARFTYSIPLDDPANDILQIVARLENNEFGDLESLQREFKLRREHTRARSVDSVHLRLLDEQWGVFSDDFDAVFLLAGVSFSERQRRGAVTDPSAGRSWFLSAEVAGEALGSDQDLLRTYASYTGVRRLGEHWRVVTRGEVGALWSGSRRPDLLPPSLGFFAGGDNSIRGFAYQSVGREVSPAGLSDEVRKRSLVVGGTRLLTGSVEVQRYIGENWRAALFVDAGDAFVDDFDTNVGVGFGVHYISPVGALRLELANPVTRSEGSWRLHINIGAEF